MNSKRVSYIMIGVVSLLAVACFAVVGLGAQLLQQRSQKLTQLKVDNQLLESQQTALVQANKDIQKYSDLEKIAKTIVPQDKDQAKAVREILKIAGDTQIPIASISFPSSSLGAIVPKVTPNSGSSSTTTPVVTAPTVTQVKPVDGMTGLYSMEITVQSDQTNPRPYGNLISFLARLEENRRTAQVTQLVITPNQKDISKLSFTLTIKVFIKP